MNLTHELCVKNMKKVLSCKIKLRNMSQHSFFWLLLSSFLSTVQCWGNGYTQDICGSLTPSDTDPQDSSSPYSLTVAVSRYIIGGEVEVEIKASGENVVGFIVQARKADGSSTTPVGTWGGFSGIFQQLECDAVDDTITHRGTGPKGQSVKLKWLAPADCSYGSVKFHATVASGRYAFWTGIESAELTRSTSTSTTTAATTTTIAATQEPSTATTAATQEPPTVTTAEKGATMATEPKATGSEQQGTTFTDSSNTNTTTTTAATNTKGGGNGSETLGGCTAMLLACYGLFTLNRV